MISPGLKRRKKNHLKNPQLSLHFSQFQNPSSLHMQLLYPNTRASLLLLLWYHIYTIETKAFSTNLNEKHIFIPEWTTTGCTGVDATMITARSIEQAKTPEGTIPKNRRRIPRSWKPCYRCCHNRTTTMVGSITSRTVIWSGPLLPVHKTREGPGRWRIGRAREQIAKLTKPCTTSCSSEYGRSTEILLQRWTFWGFCLGDGHTDVSYIKLLLQESSTSELGIPIVDSLNSVMG